MKFYKNLLYGVVEALFDIHYQNKYADKIIQKLIKNNKKWGSKDRKLVAGLSYDITRYRRLYFYIADVDLYNSERKDLWKVIGAYILHKGYELPPFDEFKVVNVEEFKTRIEEANNSFVLRESIPDWLNKVGEEALGQEVWQKEVAEQNKEAEVVLRVNKIGVPKGQKDRALLFVQEELLNEGIQTEILEDYPEALQLRERKNIMHTKAYKKGWVEIQDASSQLVAPFTNAKEGMLVIDACAGAGGKTLHLANQMNNKGKLLSLEVVRWKLDELKKRADRARVDIIATDIPDLSVLNEFQNAADVVLVDAPCTGLGTMKRKADLRWKINEDFVRQQVELQAQILQQYSQLVAVGGTLVYATCSVLPQENKQQIEDFLTTEVGKKFKFEEDKQLLASQTGYDGFYMARLKREWE